MAMYRLSVKSGASGSSRAHFDYISRNGKYKRAENKNLKEDFIVSNSFNIPHWAKDPRDFWKEEEKKMDGYKKIEVALPTELSHEENKALLEKFLKEEFGKDYVYSYAIHENIGILSEKKNPHAHIMFSERKIDHNREVDRDNWFKRGGKKKDGTISGGYRKDRKFLKQTGSNWVEQIRQKWEDLQNEHLKDYGVTVSCKSLADQGIDRIPQIYLGYKNNRIKGKYNDRKNAWNMTKSMNLAINPMLKTIPIEIEKINKEIKDLQNEIEEIQSLKIKEKTISIPKIVEKPKIEHTAQISKSKTEEKSVSTPKIVESPKIEPTPTVAIEPKIPKVIPPKPIQTEHTAQISKSKTEEKSVSTPKIVDNPKIEPTPTVAIEPKIPKVIPPKPIQTEHTAQISKSKTEEKSVSAPKIVERPKIEPTPTVAIEPKKPKVITPKPIQTEHTAQIPKSKTEEKSVSTPKIVERPKIEPTPTVAIEPKKPKVITPKPIQTEHTAQISKSKTEEKSVSAPKIVERPKIEPTPIVKRVGTFIDKHPNGQIKTDGKFTEDGQPTGKWRIFHENGKKRAEGIYRGGVKQDTWKYYDERGSLIREEKWRDGKKIKEREIGSRSLGR